MSDTPPVVGQVPWGEDLNGYLASLEARVAAVEAKPEYVFNSAAWQFSNLTPPATGSQLRLNNPQAALATVIDVRRIDSDGADRTPWFQMISADAHIRFQDWDNSAVFYRYTATGPATFDSTNVQIPVTWESGSGVVPNAKINVGLIVILVL